MNADAIPWTVTVQGFTRSAGHPKGGTVIELSLEQVAVLERWDLLGRARAGMHHLSGNHDRVVDTQVSGMGCQHAKGQGQPDQTHAGSQRPPNVHDLQAAGDHPGWWPAGL